MYRIRMWVVVGVLCGVAGVFARIENHGQVVRVNDILMSDTGALIATNGGLYVFSPSRATGILQHGSDVFVDLRINAICRDNRGRIWAATRGGYLYCRYPDGRTETFTYYTTSDTSGNAVVWDILDLYPYGDYLIISSSEGVSFFHTATHAVKNVPRIAGFSSSVVYETVIYNDTLFAAGQNRVGMLDIGAYPIATFNNYDRTLWESFEPVTTVRHFCVTDTGVAMHTWPVVLHRETYVCADDTALTLCTGADTLQRITLPSTVTSIAVDEGMCIIGTEDDYFFQWDIAAPAYPAIVSAHTIEGLTFQYVNRVQTDQRGHVWMLSRGDKSPAEKHWWKGIMYFDDPAQRWHHFGRSDFGDFASADNNADFRGICIPRQGDRWFGTPKSGVKRFVPGEEDSTWYEYYLGPRHIINDIYYPEIARRGGWNKSGAVAMDSAGNLWMGGFNNGSGNIVCWAPRTIDPQQEDYFRYFPDSSDHYMVEVSFLEVDAQGTVYAGGTGGKLLILQPVGDPVKGDVQVTQYDLRNKIIDIVAGSGDSCWVLTEQALWCKYVPDDAADGAFVVEKATRINGKITGGISCVAFEYEGSLWVGTKTGALVHCEYDRTVVFEGGSPVDTVKYTFSTIDARDGLLVQSHISDLAIDRSTGHLWVAGNNGVSRYMLGHEFAPVSDTTALRVYPNPFSRSDPSHTHVTMTGCRPGARVAVYTLSGSLVTVLASPEVSTRYANTFQWSPGKGIQPGMYIVVSHTGGQHEVRKLMINP
jgi:hypothetical protein